MSPRKVFAKVWKVREVFGGLLYFYLWNQFMAWYLGLLIIARVLRTPTHSMGWDVWAKSIIKSQLKQLGYFFHLVRSPEVGHTSKPVESPIQKCH